MRNGRDVKARRRRLAILMVAALVPLLATAGPASARTRSQERPAVPDTVAAVPANTPIAILSNDNTRWVSAEIGYGGGDNAMLRARAGIHGPWEKFTIVSAGGGQWAIRSNANGLYVSAEMGYGGGDYAMLRARASVIGPWERFTFIPFQTRATAVRPVYIIHGFSDGTNCGNQFGNLLNAFQFNGVPAVWSRSQLVTVGFYRGDSNCDTYLPIDGVNQFGPASQEGTKDESVKELGRELSWEIYNRYSRFGISVDIVVHSLGGLITRAMLTGSQQHMGGWAPFVFVEDVSTLSTPHGGADLAFLCPFTPSTQCNEMRPGSETLVWMDDNPQSDIGTDWTLIGADDDETVSAARATNMCCIGHKIIYPKPQPDGNGVEHSSIPHMASGRFFITYCDFFGGCNMDDRSTWVVTGIGAWDPVRMARYGVYYERIW